MSGRSSVMRLDLAVQALDFFLEDSRDHCDDGLRGRVAACRDQMSALHRELQAMHEAGEFDEMDEQSMRKAVEWAWTKFDEDMVKWYGRRDPDCLWCGETVYMALQGPNHGGVWTTVEGDEGPCSNGLDGPGTRCSKSPDGEHDCFKTEAWLEDGFEVPEGPPAT